MLKIDAPSWTSSGQTFFAVLEPALRSAEEIFLLPLSRLVASKGLARAKNPACVLETQNWRPMKLRRTQRTHWSNIKIFRFLMNTHFQLNFNWVRFQFMFIFGPFQSILFRFQLHSSWFFYFLWIHFESYFKNCPSSWSDKYQNVPLFLHIFRWWQSKATF